MIDVIMELLIKSVEGLIEKMKENCNYDNKDKLSDYSIDLDEAIDIIKDYCKVDEMSSVTPQEPQWIPVNKRLPEKYTYTLWCSLGGNVQSDYFNGEVWEDAEKYGYVVIAWMPLPKPYKPQKSEGKKYGSNNTL